jgi:hypothetical protein
MPFVSDTSQSRSSRQALWWAIPNQSGGRQPEMSFNFLLKSAHFLIIFAQNARISVNFCVFSTIFEKSLFCV